MRVVNSLLHFALNLLFVALMLAAMGYGQTQGNIPQITDVYSDASLSQPTEGSVTMGENVVIGDKLIAVVRSVTLGFVLSDTLLNSWTCTTPLSTLAPLFTTYIYFCYADASSSGADIITACPASQCNLRVMRGVHLGAVDGSPVNATNNVVGVSSFSSSITTSTNGSLIISGGINDSGGTSFIRGQYLTGAITAASANLGTTMTTTGAHGTYTVTMDADSPSAFGNNANQAMQSIAFKPAAIALTDTVMPDAAASIAYSAQLHGVGGVAGLTYACTGLPAHGLSLNTATGVISGATPTAATLSLSCTVTDGITTSSPDALTLLIGAAFNTPTIHGSATTIDSATTSIPGVNCGDVIVIIARGDNTHNVSGWLQKWNGSGNFVSDTLGSPVQRYVGPWGGSFGYPIVAYIIGPVLTAGTDVVTIINNQSSGPNQQISPYFVISGVQSVVDSGAMTNLMTATNTSSIAATYITLVPNELLLGAIIGQGATTINPVGTPSMGAPFSSNSYGVPDAAGISVYGSYLSPTATSVTLTNSVTAQGTNDNTWTTMLVPLRPALPLSSCPTSAAIGEKIRRQVF